MVGWTRGSPPVSRIFLTPARTKEAARRTISSSLSRWSLGESSTPSGGMQYVPARPRRRGQGGSEAGEGRPVRHVGRRRGRHWEEATGGEEGEEGRTWRPPLKAKPRSLQVITERGDGGREEESESEAALLG